MNRLAHAANRKDYLVFSLAGREFGLALDMVQELCSFDVVSPLPGAPFPISGIAARGGRQIPIVDLHAMFDPGTRNSGRAADVVILRDEDRMSGLAVDCVIDVIVLADSDISACDAGDSGVVGVARHGRRSILLLDARRLMTDFTPVPTEKMAA